MKIKDLKRNTFASDWTRLARSPDGLHELWKTPTKYLVCSHYNKIFKYFKTKNEAIAEFYKTI